jgi:hypothetical protein
MYISVQQLAEKINKKERFTLDELQQKYNERQEKAMKTAEYHTYKVIFEIYEKKESKPFFRTYAFTCLNGKRNAIRIANDIIADYITDMGYYVGSVYKITEIK